jgi:NAD(P)-dependent dehydrogenase (short-subunit alcohol dehydrogenase family)
MTTTNPSRTTPIALVTGSSRGLGRSMALHLADRGVDVVVTYRTKAQDARDVVAKIEAKGRKAVALALDVGDSKTFAAFAAELRAALRRTWDRETFSFLVNNGGTGGHAAFAETTEAQFDELMRVHLKGPYFLTQSLLPMIEDGGRIVNISSGLARFTFAGASAYASMKGGLEVLTRYMAKELAPRGIRVNTLAPGGVETDFNGAALRDNPGLNKAVASQTALGRVGLPDDIGGALAVLLSPEAQWITGQRIEVSGGMVL